MPGTAAGRGRPRPRGPPGHSASSREARPPEGVSCGADLLGRQRLGRGPASLLSPGLAGGAALTCLWARAVAAAPPGKGRSASHPPGARRGEERGAKGAGRRGRTRSRGPARRAGLDSAAPGADDRSASHTGVPSAPRLRQREPAPGRSRSPSGRRRREGRGHRVGDPLTRKQLWPRRRALRSGCNPGQAKCTRLSRGELCAARETVLLPLCPATASDWGRAGRSTAGRNRGWGGGPGRPRGGSSRPAVPAQPLRPREQGRRCELMRVQVQGHTFPGHL